jgi:hypothetical protein
MLGLSLKMPDPLPRDLELPAELGKADGPVLFEAVAPDQDVPMALGVICVVRAAAGLDHAAIADAVDLTAGARGDAKDVLAEDLDLVPTLTVEREGAFGAGVGDNFRGGAYTCSVHSELPFCGPGPSTTNCSHTSKKLRCVRSSGTFKSAVYCPYSGTGRGAGSVALPEDSSSMEFRIYNKRLPAYQSRERTTDLSPPRS